METAKKLFPIAFWILLVSLVYSTFRLYRLDMWHGLITIRPHHVTYWISMVHEHWSLCRYSFYATGVTGYVIYSVSVVADGHERGPCIAALTVTSVIFCNQIMTRQKI